MEDPVKDITPLIRSLCQGTPEQQEVTINTHFLPNASFMHPFCQVPSFTKLPWPAPASVNSRWFVLAIYRWYRILSPRIDFRIDSCAFDKESAILYVNLEQTFAIWFIPFYKARVRLVTVLYLVESRLPPQTEQDRDSGSGSGTEGTPHPRERHVAWDHKRAVYRIAKQADHYQVNDFLKFVLPAVGPLFCSVFQLYATLICVAGVLVFGCGRGVLERGVSYVPALRGKMGRGGVEIEQ